MVIKLLFMADNFCIIIIIIIIIIKIVKFTKCIKKLKYFHHTKIYA